MNRALLALLACILSSATALAQDYDFDWATIDHPNNAAYPGDPEFGSNAGRGSVPYTYRMPKLETTTSQWMEFLNTFRAQGYNMSDAVPVWWGARDAGNRYSFRTGIPSPDLVPVQGITWRWAAKYCNWLHNGKSTAFDSILNGAYDASTFGTNANGSFTDQLYHSPDAKFWIPTLDEWLKAAHFDPNKNNGAGGWWEYDTTSDTAPIPGPPGVGQTSAGYRTTGLPQWDYPLGSYPDTTSPWGLLDLSGGAQEWLEETDIFFPTYRSLDGTYAACFESLIGWDKAGSGSANYPGIRGASGLRVASSVPDPPAILLGFPTLLALLAPRRRR